MNILTLEQKEDVLKIYKRKFLIVLFTVFILSGIIFMIAITPIYIQLNTHSGLLERQIVEIQSSELNAIQNKRLRAIRDFDTLAVLFEGSAESLTEHITTIANDFDGVYINDIKADYQEEEIVFAGQADTRANFVKMTDFLNAAEWSEGVFVPATLLTKSTDIAFSLKIKLNTEYVD